MKVKAIKLGFYQGSRKRPGVVFDLVSEKHFSDQWMEKLEPEVEKPKAKAKAKPEPEELPEDKEVI